MTLVVVSGSGLKNPLGSWKLARVMMQSLTPKYCVPHRKAWFGTGLLEDVRGTVKQLGKRILFSASQTHPGPVVNTLIQLIHYVCCSIPKLLVVSCQKLPCFCWLPYSNVAGKSPLRSWLPIESWALFRSSIASASSPL